MNEVFLLVVKMPLPAALAARLAKRGIVKPADIEGEDTIDVRLFIAIRVILNQFVSYSQGE